MMLFKSRAELKSITSQSSWSRTFVWLPVKTIDKEWIWLEYAEKINYFSPLVQVNAPVSFFGLGLWCYRRIDRTNRIVT